MIPELRLRACSCYIKGTLIEYLWAHLLEPISFKVDCQLNSLPALALKHASYVRNVLVHESIHSDVRIPFLRYFRGRRKLRAKSLLPFGSLVYLKISSETVKTKERKAEPLARPAIYVGSADMVNSIGILAWIPGKPVTVLVVAAHYQADQTCFPFRPNLLPGFMSKAARELR